MQGRYHPIRLHPFSLAELVGKGTLPDIGKPLFLAEKQSKGAPSDQLFRFSGFPEPFLRSEDRFFRRWQKERMERVVREAVRDLSAVQDLSLIRVQHKKVSPEKSLTIL